VIAGFVLSAIMGRLMGGMLAGLGAGAVAMLFFGLGIMVVFIALMVFFIVGIKHRGGSGWTSGGGGFGSGGSWGGGGGSFGGGGASGSW